MNWIATFVGYVLGGATAAACFAGLAAGLSVLVGPPEPNDGLSFREPDPKFRDAIIDARATLPYFYDAARKPGAKAAYLRIAVPTVSGPRAVTHIWLEDCDFTEGRRRCAVSAPAPGASLNEGDLIDVAPEAISDWMLRDKETGRIEGGYTVRALMPQMSTEGRKDLARRLDPLPSP